MWKGTLEFGERRNSQKTSSRSYDPQETDTDFASTMEGRSWQCHRQTGSLAIRPALKHIYGGIGIDGAPSMHYLAGFGMRMTESWAKSSTGGRPVS